MSMLSRWSPFKHPVRIDAAAEFDDLFRGLGMRSLLREIEPAPQMKLEVSEDDDHYTVKAELAGVDKDDIEVTVDGNLVGIVGEVKRESEQKEGERIVHSERYFGRVARSFTLPTDVDDGKVVASYDKGVLSLVLSKKPNGSRRRISIA